MDRTDVAVVINSTPKFYCLLKATVGLFRRYAEGCTWPVYIASEEPESPSLKALTDVTIVPLKHEDSYFWESRIAVVKALPKEIKYVLPLQDDFMVERVVDKEAFAELLTKMDATPEILSARLMPSPGPVGTTPLFGNWIPLSAADPMGFTYQATLWRREHYVKYLQVVVQTAKQSYGEHFGTPEWNRLALTANLAESEVAKSFFFGLKKDNIHLAWKRKGPWSNAVYWSPLPYRPTAVVRGVLQPWAQELMAREGWPLAED